MGFFSKVWQLPSLVKGKHKPPVRRTSSQGRGLRACRVEELDQRRLLAADIHLGLVYYEDSGGFDEVGDRFELTWQGGAAGSQLTQIVIDTDKEGNGLSNGDVFFDIANGGAGVYGSFPFQVVSSAGFQINSVEVSDGGTKLILKFSGFDAGERLVFSIDADEQAFLKANAVAEGAEFEGSILTATFNAPHYYQTVATDIFYDDYDPKLIASGLDLPRDDYQPPNDEPTPVRTAAAVMTITQTPLPISISGVVYEDIDLDNTQDPGDLGIAGVTLTLFAFNGLDYVSTGRTTITDGVGAYRFDNVLPGTYCVVETQPNGYFSIGATAGKVDGATRGFVSTVDVISGIELLGGEDSVRNDFAEARPARLSGQVYHDVNNDGLMQAAEPGIANVLIEVYRIVNGGPQPAPIVVQTDVAGFWSVDGLIPGQYRVVEIHPNGWIDGRDVAGTAGGSAVNPGDEINGIHLTSGQHGENYKFGELLPNSISGRVHADRDGDCIIDPGEPLLAGVVVELLDNNGQVIRTTTTNSAGEYKFENLAPGTYGVREIQPAGYFDSGEMPGSLGGVVSTNDTITQIVLISDQHGVNYDFCELEPASISGHVHADRDGDCIIDPGEPLLAGIVIELLDANGQVIRTTTTNSAGVYKFDNLAPGTYGVREIQPVGYFDSGEMPGSAGGVVSANDTITQIVLGANVDAVNYDFCELEPASISGRVHADRDGDCIIDPGEPMLAGVVIELLNSTGQVIATTTTNSAGEYKFDSLAPGTYGVREIQPAGYFDSGEMAGSAGGVVSANDTITQIVLGANVAAVNYDFCELEPASISGHVHADRDGDCIIDPGEPMLAGVTIQLLNSTGQVIATTLTNSAGEYKFDNLAPGTYGVREIQPAGYFDSGEMPGSAGGVVSANDTITQIVLGANVDAVNYDFCELEPASISGRVHADRDGDCIIDPGEPMLAGVVIELLDANGQVIRTTTTNSAGVYKFDSLAPGTYGVREIQPSGYFDSGEMAGSAGGVVSANDTITQIVLGANVAAMNYDFCELEPASISGHVHADRDGDCIIDPGEPMLAGVTIQLLDAAGNVIATTVTNSAGQYRFDGLAPGEYGVREIQPAGYFDSGEMAGSAGGIVSANDTITQIVLGAGVNAVNYDFCEHEPASLSGYVYEDANNNGQFEAGERPIAGVTVVLLDANGLPLGPTAVTSASGFYLFAGLAPGTYGVSEVQPEGWDDGLDTAGTAGGVAFNPGDLITGAVLTPGLAGLNYNFGELGDLIPNIVFPPQLVIPPLPSPLALYEPRPVQPYEAPYAPRPELDLYYGGGHVIGYTWHLSVINAGHPRGAGRTLQNVARLTSLGPSTYLLQSEGFPSSVPELHWSHWTLEEAESGEPSQTRGLRFGMRQGTPVTGDFNGDGVSDVGVFYMGHWYIDVNGNGRWDSEDLWAKLGNDGDLPVTGDWDGDGKTDIGIFGRAWPGDPRAIAAEPGLPDPLNLHTGTKNVPPTTEEAAKGWRTMKRSSAGPMRADLIDHVFHYGTPGDRPIAGDWNGAGVATIGIFRDGDWILDADGDGRSSEGDMHCRYGAKGDLPVVGDFNGDGTDEIGVYRGGSWILDTNNNRTLDDDDLRVHLGTSDDLPVVGDWNGDGVDEPGLYNDAGVSSSVQAAPLES